jgi:hypothetical protein
LHLKATGPPYTGRRRLDTEGSATAVSRSRGTGLGKPIARGALGSSLRMLTPGAVLIVDCQASLLGFIGGHTPTVPTAGTAGFNTHSESTGLRHIGDSFERLGDHLVPEFPEAPWGPIGRNRNTLGTAVEYLGPPTPELTALPPEQPSLSPTSMSRLADQYRFTTDGG